MGKKKGSRRSRASEADEFASDAASLASTSTLASLADFGLTDLPDDPFERVVEALYEKRASTREAALEGLEQLLTAGVCVEQCSQREETLAGHLVSSLRRGSGAETVSAARCLALMGVTYGSGAELERLYERALLPLQKQATGGTSEPSRAAAVHALAMLTFVSTENLDAADTVLAGLLTLGGQTGSPRVATAALRGWALQLTALPQWRLNGDFCEAALGPLSKGLAAADINLRAAAGDSITLLYTSSGLGDILSGASGEEDVEEEEGDATGPLGDVMARMQMLATNRGEEGTRRSRRDRAALRRAFRALVALVQDGGSTKETRVKLRHGDSLCVDTLAGQVQLAAFRSLLAEGFQAHLQDNVLLHEVFGYEPRRERAERLTPGEKRALREPVSKARDVSRAYDRAANAAYKGALLVGSY